MGGRSAGGSPPLKKHRDSETAQEQAERIVVGIGTSAGGQDALEQFFATIPAESGLAFVVIMHLPPEAPSFLAEMLSRCISMEVVTIEDGMRYRPDTVYVIQAGKVLTLKNGRFLLKELPSPLEAFHPVDRFFDSLASEFGRRAVAVILSGGGTDGAVGAKAIGEAGGIVLAQAPDTATNPSMPLNAIATGAVDLILPAEELADNIAGMVRGTSSLQAFQTTTLDEDIAALLAVVTARTGHDFSSYKKNTVIRRIERRMAVHEMTEIKDYLAFMESDEPEAHALGQEILIGVTSFFRDQEAFEILSKKILPRLFENRSSLEPVRIWHACCATGEEVYSTAILIQEYLLEHKTTAKVQIFATDIDERAIAQARAGLYGGEIRASLSEERLKAFFTRVDGRLQVAKPLREMVVFASHNLIKDPPFSRLDLLVCRNFLIYLNSDMQKRLFSIFHQALRPRRILFLGTAETAGQHSELFVPIDKKWKIYERLDGNHDAGSKPLLATQVYRLPHHPGLPAPPPSGELKPGQLAEKRIIDRYAPPCMVVNENYQVVHVSTRADQFLKVPVGEPTRD
ncbi:MAG TPA: chemotaxis protein CheB, partial [Desulfuromonadales bacterium]|nr:chemotaxis protein CheB [Desulfuromonadales bacterium]